MSVFTLFFRKPGSIPVAHITPFRRDRFENMAAATEVEKLLDFMDLKL
jgi:hypothetical protein